MPTSSTPPAATTHPVSPGPAAVLVAQVRPACTVLMAMALITGVVYPLGMTAVTQIVFPRQAAGSPVRDHTGAVRGSSLIGQSFTGPQWFHGRPSVTGTAPYDPTASGGSNLGPTNPALAAAVGERATALLQENPAHSGPIPVDLVTASGSGLDPHVSPAAALLQVPRVAAARGLGEDVLRMLVKSHVEPALFGVLGRPRVNVLQLNRALEEMVRAATSPSRQ
jgi:potassium-transporting ATPase KdpC subunit